MNSLSIAYLVVLASSFLLGSIPWGLLISRFAYKTDIREHGSGNIGAANAMRVFGAKGGTTIFVLDFLKGVLAGAVGLAVCALVWPGQPLMPLIAPLHHNASFINGDALRAVACIGAILGHVFSPWLGFRGGKGVAVGVGGIIFVLGPIGALIEITAFIGLTALTRYISVGSLAAALICPFLALWLLNGSWVAIILCFLVTFVVFWAHRDNIKRLLNHTENRFGTKKSDGVTGVKTTLKSSAPLKADASSENEAEQK